MSAIALAVQHMPEGKVDWTKLAHDLCLGHVQSYAKEVGKFVQMHGGLRGPQTIFTFMGFFPGLMLIFVLVFIFNFDTLLFLEFVGTMAF